MKQKIDHSKFIIKYLLEKFQREDKLLKCVLLFYCIILPHFYETKGSSGICFVVSSVKTILSMLHSTSKIVPEELSRLEFIVEQTRVMFFNAKCYHKSGNVSALEFFIVELF